MSTFKAKKPKAVTASNATVIQAILELRQMFLALHRRVDALEGHVPAVPVPETYVGGALMQPVQTIGYYDAAHGPSETAIQTYPVNQHE